MAEIVRCVSCDGFGWYDDDFSDETLDCDWCGGVGYVYRDDNGVDFPISKHDLKKSEVSEQLEALETERMREMGYSGMAKKPWQQDIRKGTQGGINPYEDANESN